MQLEVVPQGKEEMFEAWEGFLGEVPESISFCRFAVSTLSAVCREDGPTNCMLKRVLLRICLEEGPALDEQPQVQKPVEEAECVEGTAAQHTLEDVRSHVSGRHGRSGQVIWEEESFVGKEGSPVKGDQLKCTRGRHCYVAGGCMHKEHTKESGE